MENFRIDFTLSNPFPDGRMLGECGEKNAAQLIITPPEDLASREEIRSYVVAFSTEKGPVRYGPVAKTETVTVPVCSALTVGTALSVQLEGYDSDGEFVIKSRVITGITLSNSIVDCDTGLSDDVTEIPGHSHENCTVLDSFRDVNGNLIYKNKLITDKNTVSVNSTVLNTGDFFVLTDSPVENSILFIALDNSDGELIIPEGIIIRSIEVNTASHENPEWIDLHNLNDADSFVPYVVNMYRTLYSEMYAGTILATVYFPCDTNNFYHTAGNYDINSIRVVYEESGEK